MKVVHCKKESYDVYIGRPSFWENPFKIGEHGDRRQVLARYMYYLSCRPDIVQRAREELNGKILGCWCAPKACHGDILLAIANSESFETKVFKDDHGKNRIRIRAGACTICWED